MDDLAATSSTSSTSIAMNCSETFSFCLQMALARDLDCNIQRPKPGQGVFVKLQFPVPSVARE